MNHRIIVGEQRLQSLFLALLLAILAGPNRTSAVIFMNSSDPAYNTTAPDGRLQNSGWDLQGRWGSFLGTPVAPHWFLTAKHVGGNVGDTFLFRGVSYQTASRVDDPQSDLVLWSVNGTFPAYATPYSENNEVGKPIVVFGRGTQRGPEVAIGGLFGSQPKGWYWGPPDGVMRWGESTVDAVISDNGGLAILNQGTQNNTAELLKMGFNTSGGINEAHLSTGDSGGGLFIESNGLWKLAGINYAVDGPYNTTPSGYGFGAAVFDEGGLYKGGEGNWTAIPDLPTDQPGNFYATRVSSRYAWLRSTIATTTTPEPLPTLQFQSDVTTSFATDSVAEVNATQKIIRTLLSGAHRFYRITFTRQVRITHVQLDNDYLVLTYE